MGDLRPYIGEYESFTGIDSPALDMNSYPYIIQSQYRTGAKHHFEDGSRTTLFVSYKGEILDLCNYPTKVANISDLDKRVVELEPIELEFSDGFKLKLKTTYTFDSNGKIFIAREVLEKSDETAEVYFTEYLKGCYGFTEYPEKMKEISLYADEKKVADYNYAGKSYVTTNGKKVSVMIPQITTEVELSAVSSQTEYTEIKEGTLFSPFYTMRIVYPGSLLSNSHFLVTLVALYFLPCFLSR